MVKVVLDVIGLTLCIALGLFALLTPVASILFLGWAFIQGVATIAGWL